MRINKIRKSIISLLPIVHFVRSKIQSINECFKLFIKLIDKVLIEFILLYSNPYCILCKSDINADDIAESKKLLLELYHMHNHQFLKYAHISEYYFCPHCLGKVKYGLSKVVRCTFCSGFYQTETKIFPPEYYKGLTPNICRENHDMPFILNYSLLPFFDFFHDSYIKAKYNNDIVQLWLFFALGINNTTSPVLEHLSHIIDVIVPVPMSFRKRFTRNYNVSELLAKNLGKLMGKKVFTVLKERGKAFQHINRKSEFINRYSLKRKIKKKYFLSNKAVLLVDDIYTTGSTMKTCAQICKDAGAEKIYTVTLFRTIYASSNI